MFNRCPTNFTVSEESCVPPNITIQDFDTVKLSANISVSTSMYPLAVIVTGSLSTRSAYEAIVLPTNLAISASQVVQGFSTVCSRTANAAYNISLPSAAELAAKELEIHGMAVLEGQRLLPIIIHNNNTVGAATLVAGAGVTLSPTLVTIPPNKTATCIISFISATQVAGLCSVSS